MSSSDGGIGSTLTGGIQDISAILPLLGTEQCSEQVSSALTRGYLYAASTPMSIFGSLGVVSAGFKTLVACISFGDIEGAKILGNVGFEPQGENLSLIMVESGKACKGKNTGRYIIETRMDELINELNIDKNRITGVSHKSAAWNAKMVATTALLCALSITPYIYLNLVANNLTKSTTWVFPILRATGGFITATLIQLLIQRRITILSDQYLVKRDQLRNKDVEAAANTKKYQMVARYIAPTWLLLCFLLIGLVASVVGYIGCFSVVQNSTSTVGPVSWLCLESGLSVMRLAIWAWNPTGDDAPPLEIILELDKYEHNPLPTCNKDNDEILEYKVLPLTRARNFLKIITSFAGLIEPFSNPDLSLYYTLTRNRPWENRDKEPENAERHRLGERILYITVFDHKERTTRVYTRDDEGDTFYSTKSDAPVVDVGHFLLEVEIDARIDPKGDPVSSDSNILDSLRKHYRSILEHIHYRLGARKVTTPYAIENSWTMKVEDTISAIQRLKEENGNVWKAVVEKGEKEEQNEKSLPICDYFRRPSIGRERQLLSENRVKWIARRMEATKAELDQGRPTVKYRVNNLEQAVEKMPGNKEREQMLYSEQYLIELLLLYEEKEWERLFWNKLKAFVGNDRVEDEERLAKEWRSDCLKRLNPLMHAAVKRLDDLRLVKDKNLFLENLSDWWASSISQLLDGVEKPHSISLPKLRQEMAGVDEGTRLRMEVDIEDTEFRLKHGSDNDSDLRRFRVDDWGYDLFRCKYSLSKWLCLDKSDRNTPLETILHVLKGNKNIIHITFRHFDSDSDVNLIQATICDLPWVTSINWDSLLGLPAVRRDPLFIKSATGNNDLITFAKEIRPKMDPFSTYIFTDATSERFCNSIPGSSNKLGLDSRVLISFVAPTSGQSLILRLKHYSRYKALEVTLGSTIIQVPASIGWTLEQAVLSIDDITLYHPISGPSESDHLSFEPAIRNDIVIQEIVGNQSYGHSLDDVELLDEAGLRYMPHSASLSLVSTD